MTYRTILDQLNMRLKDQKQSPEVYGRDRLLFFRSSEPFSATVLAVQLKDSKVVIPAGTAIATFDPSGTYGNHTDGRSHGAIYVSQNADGVLVYDQWTGQPVHQRTIHFRNGSGSAVNDGDQFYVVD